MDADTEAQVRSFWPDVAGPFARVIPDGCRLVRLLDDWTGGPRPLRRRRLELVPAPGSPRLRELLEEAREDAERRGWTRLDDAEAPGVVVLELEDVLLRLELTAVELLGAHTRTLAAAFDQRWPTDAGAPVETSEVFQNLVRRLLRLGGEPERLVKEVTLDPLGPLGASQAERIREVVELSNDRDLRSALLGLAFGPEPGGGPAWVSESSGGSRELRARVLERPGRVEVELTSSRVVGVG